MSAAEATYCTFRYLVAVDEISQRWFVWDLTIRVEPDGVCGDNPIQFYARQPGEMEPEPQGRVEVQGSTVWMWFKGLPKPTADAE